MWPFKKKTKPETPKTKIINLNVRQSTVLCILHDALMNSKSNSNWSERMEYWNYIDDCVPNEYCGWNMKVEFTGVLPVIKVTEPTKK